MTNDTSDSRHGGYDRKVKLKELHIAGGVTDDTSDRWHVRQMARQTVVREITIENGRDQFSRAARS